ncbi:MAG: nitrate reductase molybdenum cofactor assembly chaperone [Rhodanobacter sp.]|nr:MAG: nitrate reductase molybdenum cofactor assembly chaperone [Rhodanobacter sp.]TAM38455.1 MAG: nitrate reductase molybdenum cofactor assembly chaperone [Rhodanobacter sp.]TAN27021.1 MAG: nitrate reductase molybdenum cofactor assembly chaperone [Rhodanobacter sp.]
MSVLKLIGVLLDYPQDELWECGEELLAAAHESTLPVTRQQELVTFVKNLLDTDTLTAQDDWLQTFDRGRSMSLLLFEHIHGESRDRGQAMVDLIAAYRKNGFELSAKELPDYLPLLLEYLAHRPQTEVSDWLSHISHIVGMLAARAMERHSPYQLLFQILVDLADGRVDLGALRQRASEEPRDDTAEAMDRVWEEEVVRFGAEAPADDCAPAGRKPRPSAAVQVQP